MWRGTSIAVRSSPGLMPDDPLYVTPSSESWICGNVPGKSGRKIHLFPFDEASFPTIVITDRRILEQGAEAVPGWESRYIYRCPRSDPSSPARAEKPVQKQAIRWFILQWWDTSEMVIPRGMKVWIVYTELRSQDREHRCKGIIFISTGLT
jgi:hypothetical protein